MKILLYILAAIFILIILILLSAVKIKVSFTMKNFSPISHCTISLLYGIIRFKLIPNKPKKPEKRKKKAETKEEIFNKDEIIQKIMDNPMYYVDLIFEILKIVLKFCKKSVKILLFRLNMIYSSGNPFTDGISFSGTAPVSLGLYTLLNEGFNLRESEIEIRPDFSNSPKCDIDFNAVLKIRVSAFIRLLKFYFENKHIEDAIKELFNPAIQKEE